MLLHFIYQKQEPLVSFKDINALLFSSQLLIIKTANLVIKKSNTPIDQNVSLKITFN